MEEENGKKMPPLPWLAGYVHVIGMVVHLQHAKATSDKWFSILSGDSTNKMRLVIRIAIVINLVWVHKHVATDCVQKPVKISTQIHKPKKHVMVKRCKQLIHKNESLRVPGGSVVRLVTL